MNRNEIVKKVTKIFRNVLNDDSIILAGSMTTDDIEGWDSLSHIMIISDIERVFHFKFTMKDMTSMKNVGELLDVIMRYKENDNDERR